CRRGAAAFDRAGALARGVAKQDFVEFRAAYLIGRRKGLVPSVGKVEADRLLVPGRYEFGAVFRHADASDLFGHAQPLEERQVERQQRLADVKARMALLLEQHHVAAALREQRRERRSGGSPADNEYFAARHASPRCSKPKVRPLCPCGVLPTFVANQLAYGGAGTRFCGLPVLSSRSAARVKSSRVKSTRTRGAKTPSINREIT